MKKPRREDSGHSTKMRISRHRSLESHPEMESTVYLVAEWVSGKKMEPLQSVCMLVSIKSREKENEEFLSDPNDQVWKEMSEERQRGRKPCPVIKRCVQQSDWNHRGKTLG